MIEDYIYYNTWRVYCSLGVLIPIDKPLQYLAA